MRIVSWNVNSLRARLARMEELLSQHQPDVVLLQETKTSEEQFPHDELAAMGYGAVDRSSGRWTGVAILAREGLAIEEPELELFAEPLPEEARWVEATIAGIRFVSVYVINGRELGHAMYDAKLEMLDAMAARAAELRAEGRSVIIAGDLNIAPRDVDVWNPLLFEGTTHTSALEREGLEAIMKAGGLVDAHVARYGPDAQQFTWWDYRAGSFHKGQGLRIDLHLVSEDLAGRIADVRILRDLRKGEKPSDHAPLELELTD